MNFKEFIDNDDNFERVLEETDAQLKADSVLIPGRSIAGLSEISKRFTVSLSWDGKEARKINQWFNNRYGERMKMDFSPGSTAVQIQGDIYEVKLPLIFGSMKINVLEWILKVTPKTLHSLKPQELDALGGLIQKTYESFQYIKFLPQEATVDLETAVDHLVKEKPQNGLSQWASLQATEKTLKAYIKKHGGSSPPIHDLSKLAAIAEKLGHPQIDPALLKAVQCSPGVRYDIPVTPENALTALHSSIKICELTGKGFI